MEPQVEDDHSSTSSSGRSTPDPMYGHSRSPSTLGDGNQAEAGTHDADMDIDLPRSPTPDDNDDDDSTSASSNIAPSHAGLNDRVQRDVAPGITTSYHPVIDGA
jgi:hypothetical protein